MGLFVGCKLGAFTELLLPELGQDILSHNWSLYSLQGKMLEATGSCCWKDHGAVAPRVSGTCIESTESLLEPCSVSEALHTPGQRLQFLR